MNLLNKLDEFETYPNNPLYRINYTVLDFPQVRVLFAKLVTHSTPQLIEEKLPLTSRETRHVVK